MRLYLLAALLSAAAQSLEAQAFQNLTTTADGSILYFASPIRPIGSNQTFHSKIFRWDAAGGIRTVDEVKDEGDPTGCGTLSFYQLSLPQVSGDGNVLAYTGTRPATRACQDELNQTTAQGPAGPVTLPGSGGLSRNGRYAITTTVDAAASAYHIVTDLSSNQSTLAPGAFSGSQQQITDGGAVLSVQPYALVLTPLTGTAQVIPTPDVPGPIHEAVVTRDGSQIFYATTLSCPSCMPAFWKADSTTGQVTMVYAGNLDGPRSLSITGDGSTLLFIQAGAPSGSHLFTISTDGTGVRQLDKETDGFVSAIISGDGQTAFAVTGGSRLLRINVASGTVTELAPPTPLIVASYRTYPPETTVAAIGSVMALTGYALQQITLCGQPVPSYSKQAALYFQVPWDLPDGTCQAIVQSASPFEDEIDLQIAQYDPQFLNDPQPFIFHQNFQGFVTSSSPAHPGEVIVAYMTGLGPVDANGQLTQPLQCSLNSTSTDVLFAGLAPGLTGFYQVNLLVPDLAVSSAELVCGFRPLLGYSTVWLGPQ